MWQIKYNNIFIDLVPNQNCEIERHSPLFLIDDILAEYSTPVKLASTDNNARAIGYYFFDATVKTKKTIAVEIYDKGTFRYNASLVLQSAGMNYNSKYAGFVSGYMLIGISNFFITIKDKLLRDLSLGGDRIFNHTTEDPLDSSNGYWQHFQKTYDFSQDYVMLPCANDSFTPDDIEFTYTDGWMNKYDGTKISTRQPVVPWVKLEYLLQQIFIENGWKLDTSGIIDTEWKKLLLYSNYTISTTSYGWNGTSVTTFPKASVTINLANAMPADITCSKLIFEICKRYLWAPVCDAATNTCRLISLKDVYKSTPVDYTRYAGSGSESDFSVEEKIFAFKNNFVGEDQYPGEVDLKEYDGLIPRFSKNLLPDPNGSDYDNTLAYTYLENKYWIVDWSGSTKTWIEKSDNIYNEEPDDATDTFETDVTTLPMIWKMLDNSFFAAVPHVAQAPFTAWGIRTVIYYGMVKEVNETGNPLTYYYPLGSSINVPPAGAPKLTWSNVYHHIDYQTDYGIIEYWAKFWLQLIASTEVITQRFFLPLHVLINFRWDKIILIRNIGYLFKSFIEPLSYTGYIEGTLQKVTLSTHIIPPPPVEGDVNVHYTTQQTLFEDQVKYEALQNIKGPADATVTFTVTTLTKSNPAFYFKINDNEVFSTGYNFTIVLDSSGDGIYNVKIGDLTGSGQAVFAIIEITAVTIGTIDTPNSAGYDKVR